jgi:hypothetical protein
LLIELVLKSLILGFKIAVMGDATPCVFKRPRDDTRRTLHWFKDCAENIAQSMDYRASLKVKGDEQY